MASGISNRFVSSVVYAWVLTGCLAAGCNHAAESPVAPSVPGAPVDATRWTVTGAVTEAGATAPAPNTRIEALDGPNMGMFATGDAQGRYTLSGLQPGTFSIRATADGLEPESRSIALASAQTVDFALRRTVVIAAPDPPPTRWALTGVVRDAGTQTALAGARVEILDGKNRGSSSTTDGQGHYGFDALEQDTFPIRATAAQFESETRSVTLTANTTVDLPLRRSTPPAPIEPIMSGRVVDGLSNLGLPGVTIRIDGLGETTSEGDGTFSIVASDPEQNRTARTTGASTIDRVTRLRVPGPAATVTLMPQSIDLVAFDQMFRGDGGALHRWTSAPRVIVQRRALQFTSAGDAEFAATAAVMSTGEVSDLIADLTAALGELTGDAFGGFAEVAVETAAEGDLVGVTRPGWIVVARYQGLAAAMTFWGYTRWAWNDAGEMQAASMMFDGEFETSASQFLHSLHAHEMGHALGYNHVSARPSVMNISAELAVNTWDRDGARLAFLRRPLSQSPDVDPDPYTVNSFRSSQLFWSGAR